MKDSRSSACTCPVLGSIFLGLRRENGMPCRVLPRLLIENGLPVEAGHSTLAGVAIKSSARPPPNAVQGLGVAPILLYLQLPPHLL